MNPSNTEKKNLSATVSKALYEAVVRARKFDEKIVELYPQQEMRCPTHLSLGQEGVAAGVCGALKKEDMIFSTHRCHSHTMAKGGDFRIMFAELYGKEAGCSRGKGGSMHFVQPDMGIMGASAIVGGSIPLAVGAALAAKMQGKDLVSVAFFGDGALEQGNFHECLNFSSLKKLPVLFISENNFYATCSHLSARQAVDGLYTRAASYRIPGIQVDGTRIEDVYAAAVEAVARARRGEGPTFIEAICYRWKEHVGPNFDYNLGFRTKEELDAWMLKCPVKLFERYLTENRIMSAAELEKISSVIQKQIDEAVVFAKETPFPKPESLYEDL